MKVSFTEVAYILLSVLYFAAIWGVTSDLREEILLVSPANIASYRFSPMILQIFVIFFPAIIFFANFILAFLRKRLIFPYIIAVIPAIFFIVYVISDIVKCATLGYSDLCYFLSSILIVIFGPVFVAGIVFVVALLAILANFQIKYSKRV